MGIASGNLDKPAAILILLLSCFSISKVVADDFTDLEPAAIRVEQITRSLGEIIERGEALTNASLETLIDASADEHMILRRALGPDWDKLSAQEQEVLTGLAREYVATYAGHLVDINHSLSSATFGRERIRDLRSASIQVQLPSQQSVLVKLFERDEHWWVYDIEWGSGSILRSLRAMLLRRFQHEGSAGAVTALEAALSKKQGH